MTNQEAYEKIRAFFLRPNARLAKAKATNHTSIDPVACVYRKQTRQGLLKCGVGCLIPKSQYSPWFEGKAVFGIHNPEGDRNISAKAIPALEGTTLPFLNHVQMLHDQQASDAAEFVELLDAWVEDSGDLHGVVPVTA